MNSYANSEIVSNRGLKIDSKPKRIKEKPEYINVQEWGKRIKRMEKEPLQIKKESNEEFKNEKAVSEILEKIKKEKIGNESLDFKPKVEFKHEFDSKFANYPIKKESFDIKDGGDKEFRNGMAVLETLRNIKKEPVDIKVEDEEFKNGMFVLETLSNVKKEDLVTKSLKSKSKSEVKQNTLSSNNDAKNELLGIKEESSKELKNRNSLQKIFENVKKEDFSTNLLQSNSKIMEKCDINVAKYLLKKERLRNIKSKEKMMNLSDDLGIKPVFGNIQRNPFPNVLSHECEICHCRFVTKPLLKEHLRNFHKQNDKSFECTICNSSFKRKPDLIIHEKVRHNEN